MTSLKARLTKAKARLFGTATKDIVVPFELMCDCGHRVAGIRRASYQIATCSACDARVYVLPVNVYPATKRVRSEVLDGSVGKRLSVIVRDLVVGDSDSEPGPETQVQPTAVPGQRRSGSPVSAQQALAESDSAVAAEIRGKRSRGPGRPPKITPAAAGLMTEQVLVEENSVRVPRPDFSVLMRRVFTPFRLLMLSAVVIVTVTGVWIVAQRRIEEARKTWRREMDVAEKALQDKDLVVLQDSLSKAVLAGQVLRRNDAESRRAGSLLLQTQALQELSSFDLIAMLSGCVSDDGNFDAEKAAMAAESLRGNWFVFDCILLRSGDELKADMPLIVNSVPITVSIGSEWLQRAVTAMPQSPLLFVAPIKSGRVVDRGREFQIQLDGSSCTLVTTEFHASQLGFTAANTPGLKALLERQAEFLKSDAASAGKESQ